MKNKLLNIPRDVGEIIYKLKDIKGIGPSIEDINPQGIIKMYSTYIQIIQDMKEENGRYEVVVSKKPLHYSNGKDLIFIFGGEGIKKYRDAQYISALIRLNYPDMSKSIEESQRLKKEENKPEERKKSLLSKIFQ